MAFIDIESLGLQLSTKFHGRKKTRRIKIRDFPPFLPAVFCPLNLQFLHVFPDNHFCRIHFRCLLERCCKCQNATRNSSETAFSGAIAMPPVLDDVALLRFGIGFADTLCSQVLKSRQLTLSFTHRRTIQKRKKG